MKHLMLYESFGKTPEIKSFGPDDYDLYKKDIENSASENLMNYPNQPLYKKTRHHDAIELEHGPINNEDMYNQIIDFSPKILTIKTDDTYSIANGGKGEPNNLFIILLAKYPTVNKYGKYWMGDLYGNKYDIHILSVLLGISEDNLESELEWNFK